MIRTHEAMAGIVGGPRSLCALDLDVAENSRVAETKNFFESPEARATKPEIVKVGKELWIRECIDGNGGNTPYRISRNLALCTSAVYSKADLTTDDICLLRGTRSHTNKIFVVPKVRSVVHCSPHAQTPTPSRDSFL
jgi:hypothetical protein